MIITLTMPGEPEPMVFHSIGSTTNWTNPSDVEPGGYLAKLHEWLAFCQKHNIEFAGIALESALFSGGRDYYTWER